MRPANAPNWPRPASAWPGSWPSAKPTAPPAKRAGPRCRDPAARPLARRWRDRRTRPPSPAHGRTGTASEHRALRRPRPPAVGQLPCHLDPDRWFDRADRTHALAACLACPARSWCARQALSANASWGMWAGIWIDGNLADAAHYLRRSPRTAPPATPPPPAATHRIEPPRQPVVIHPPANHSVAAVITARSSGHCEIIAPGCRLDLDTIASRIDRCRELPDAAGGYAVCRNCRAAVDAGWSLSSLASSATLVDSPAGRRDRPVLLAPKPLDALDSAGGAAPCSLARRDA